MCIAALVTAISVGIVLLVNGISSETRPPTIGMSNDQQTILSIMWGVVMLIANGIILWGAIEMRRLHNYGLAKAAAVLAIIPCFGPFFIIGMPFGLHALSTLNRESVKQRFS